MNKADIERAIEAVQVEPVAVVMADAEALPYRKVAWIGRDLPVGTKLYAAPQVRAGWQWVPIEPTLEMIDAGCPVGETVDHFDIGAAYKASLKAAPKATSCAAGQAGNEASVLFPAQGKDAADAANRQDAD